MGEDNVFTLFLKGIFVLILGFMALAFIFPFFTSILNTELLSSMYNIISITFIFLAFVFLISIIMMGFKK